MNSVGFGEEWSMNEFEAVEKAGVDKAAVIVSMVHRVGFSGVRVEIKIKIKRGHEVGCMGG